MLEQLIGEALEVHEEGFSDAESVDKLVIGGTATPRCDPWGVFLEVSASRR